MKLKTIATPQCLCCDMESLLKQNYQIKMQMKSNYGIGWTILGPLGKVMFREAPINWASKDLNII